MKSPRTDENSEIEGGATLQREAVAMIENEASGRTVPMTIRVARLIENLMEMGRTVFGQTGNTAFAAQLKINGVDFAGAAEAQGVPTAPTGRDPRRLLGTLRQ
jgi:hypothetical protein